MPVVTNADRKAWSDRHSELNELAQLRDLTPEEASEFGDLRLLVSLRPGQEYTLSALKAHAKLVKDHREKSRKEEVASSLNDPARHSPNLWAEKDEAGTWRPCYSCGAYATRTGQPDDSDLDNALIMDLFGGYSMFFDKSPATLVLCHDCAHEACEALPWLNRLLTPDRSHAHSHGYQAANPTHEGWDIVRSTKDERMADKWPDGKCPSCLHAIAHHDSEVGGKYSVTCHAPSCSVLGCDL